MGVSHKLISSYERQDIYLVELKNNKGCVVNVSNYGATIKDFLLPQADGKLANMVLSYPDIESYFTDPHYIGCTVGRYANRIAGGKFSLGENSIELTVNELSNDNHLHGGFNGFNKKVWTLSGTFEDETGSGCTLKLSSSNMDEGYPGNLEVEINYTLTDDNELILTYKATTDQATIVNLTNHSYFNLTAGDQDISSHSLCVNSKSYTPADKKYIPTGEILPVKGTIYDLIEPQEVRQFMHDADTVNYCLDNQGELKLAAVLEAPGGITMEVSTTCPGLQLYCGNYLDGNFSPFSGICLEPHCYPDSPNHANFPSAQLMPGEIYKETTIYKFNKHV